MDKNKVWRVHSPYSLIYFGQWNSISVREMMLASYFSSSFFVLTQKRNKKSGGQPDRSARLSRYCLFSMVSMRLRVVRANATTYSKLHLIIWVGQLIYNLPNTNGVDTNRCCKNKIITFGFLPSPWTRELKTLQLQILNFKHLNPGMLFTSVFQCCALSAGSLRLPVCLPFLFRAWG